MCRLGYKLVQVQGPCVSWGGGSTHFGDTSARPDLPIGDILNFIRKG